MLIIRFKFELKCENFSYAKISNEKTIISLEQHPTRVGNKKKLKLIDILLRIWKLLMRRKGKGDEMNVECFLALDDYMSGKGKRSQSSRRLLAQIHHDEVPELVEKLPIIFSQTNVGLCS